MFNQKVMTKKITILCGIAFILTLAFSGCASTGVVQMNQDSYYIGKKDSSFAGINEFENKIAVFKEANEFCAKKGLEVKILTQTVTPTRPGKMGSSELNFRCVEKGGEAKPLRKEADTVIRVE